MKENNNQILSKEDICSFWEKVSFSKKAYKVFFLCKKEKVYGNANFACLDEANEFISFLKENGYKENEYELMELGGFCIPSFSSTYHSPHNIEFNGYTDSFKEESYSSPSNSSTSSSYSDNDKWLIPSGGIAGIIMSNVARDNGIPYEMV